MSSMLAGLYQDSPDTILAKESVLVAAERMRQRSVGCLIVIDAANKPIGIVTDRDLVIRVLADAREPSETTVGEVMTADVVIVSKDSSINSALRLMRKGSFRRLPVTDDSRRLVGIVSLDDVVMELAHNFNEIGSVVQQETPAAAFRA